MKLKTFFFSVPFLTISLIYGRKFENHFLFLTYLTWLGPLGNSIITHVGTLLIAKAIS